MKMKMILKRFFLFVWSVANEMKIHNVLAQIYLTGKKKDMNDNFYEMNEQFTTLTKRHKKTPKTKHQIHQLMQTK